MTTSPSAHDAPNQSTGAVPSNFVAHIALVVASAGLVLTLAMRNGHTASRVLMVTALAVSVTATAGVAWTYLRAGRRHQGVAALFFSVGILCLLVAVMSRQPFITGAMEAASIVIMSITTAFSIRSVRASRTDSR